MNSTETSTVDVDGEYDHKVFFQEATNTYIPFYRLKMCYMISHANSATQFILDVPLRPLNSAQADSSFVVHKKCPKNYMASMTHSFGEKCDVDWMWASGLMTATTVRSDTFRNLWSTSYGDI